MVQQLGQRDNKIDSKHQFAFHFQEILQFGDKQQETVLYEVELVHRISRILRLSVGDTFVLFDRHQHVLCKIKTIEKQSIIVSIVELAENKELQPHVTFLLPLLKREALESAVYSLAELGVNVIQLVVTQKSRKKLTEKDMFRLDKICIAAAEQSKHYAYPVVHKAQSLEDCLLSTKQDATRIVFDMTGQPLSDVFLGHKEKEIILAIGPEGGFVTQELDMFKKYNFQASLLTKTILRARQAVVVASTLFRV